MEQTEFTTLSETPALPSSLVVLAETPEIASSMLHPTVKLAAPFMSNEPGFEYFKSLIISDMPTEKPEEPEVDEKAKKPLGIQPLVSVLYRCNVVQYD